MKIHNLSHTIDYVQVLDFDRMISLASGKISH